MSSLAAARADNFYHPPDWDPRKQSRAEHATRGQPKWKAHPLRERAKKLDEGILVIRFEMPYDVRCSGCGCRVAKGVRYDAEKKAVGKYLSTKIWSFRMLCKAEQEGNAKCDQRRNPHFIEIHTDPKNAEYVVVEGAQRIGETLRTADELGVETLVDPEERKKREADPFYKLEGTAGQQAAAAPARERKAWMAALEEQRDVTWRDDYAASQALRAAHRARRKGDLRTAVESEAKGIFVPLVPEHAADAAAAARVEFGAKRARSDAVAGAKRLRLLGGSIFGGGCGGGGGGAGGPKAGGLAVGGAARGGREAKGGTQTDEERRLQLLQLRKERSMQISTQPRAAQSSAAPGTPTTATPSTTAAASPTRAPPPTAAAAGHGSARPLSLQHEEPADPHAAGDVSAGPAQGSVALVAYSDSEASED